VRIDTAHGFVFVTLDEAAAPLAEALGEVPPWLARADLAHARLKRAHRLAYDVAARWTVVVANFQESLRSSSNDRRAPPMGTSDDRGNAATLGPRAP
jgi:hypothetical protein